MESKQRRPTVMRLKRERGGGRAERAERIPANDARVEPIV